jgi:flagellar hook-length control protein FliK
VFVEAGAGAATGLLRKEALGRGDATGGLPFALEMADPPVQDAASTQGEAWGNGDVLPSWRAGSADTDGRSEFQTPAPPILPIIPVPAAGQVQTADRNAPLDTTPEPFPDALVEPRRGDDLSRLAAPLPPLASASSWPPAPDGAEPVPAGGESGTRTDAGSAPAFPKPAGPEPQSATEDATGVAGPERAAAARGAVGTTSPNGQERSTAGGFRAAPAPVEVAIVPSVRTGASPGLAPPEFRPKEETSVALGGADLAGQPPRSVNDSEKQPAVAEPTAEPRLRTDGVSSLPHDARVMEGSTRGSRDAALPGVPERRADPAGTRVGWTPPKPTAEAAPPQADARAGDKTVDEGRTTLVRSTEMSRDGASPTAAAPIPPPAGWSPRAAPTPVRAEAAGTLDLPSEPAPEPATTAFAANGQSGGAAGGGIGPATPAEKAPDAQTAAPFVPLMAIDPMAMQEAITDLGTMAPGDHPQRSPEAVSGAPPPSPNLEAGRGVAMQLVAAVSAKGDGGYEVRLSPEELGVVKLTLHVGDGTVSLLVQAERPETLDLMRRSIDLLEREFRDAGFGSLNLSFGQGGGDRQAQGAAVYSAALQERPATAANALQPAAAPGRVPSSSQLDLRL